MGSGVCWFKNHDADHRLVTVVADAGLVHDASFWSDGFAAGDERSLPGRRARQECARFVDRNAGIAPCLGGRAGRFGAYNASAFLITGISELSAGLAIGLMAAVPFWAMNVAGELIDTVRGSGLSEIINPTTGGQVSLFSLLLTQL